MVAHVRYLFIRVTNNSSSSHATFGLTPTNLCHTVGLSVSGGSSSLGTSDIASFRVPSAATTSVFGNASISGFPNPGSKSSGFAFTFPGV
jgi:hypothetical protein